MTIQAIAGFCPETAIWKMLADVSALVGDSPQRLCPRAIAVDGDAFLLVRPDESDDRFLAPEAKGDGSHESQAQLVWALGALAYYMSSGHVVFGGNGGSYQYEHPSVALPVLQKSHQALTPVMQQCLMADPSARPTLADLHDSALQGLAACQQRQREPATRTTKQKSKSHGLTDIWPEAMED